MNTAILLLLARLGTKHGRFPIKIYTPFVRTSSPVRVRMAWLAESTAKFASSSESPASAKANLTLDKTRRCTFQASVQRRRERGRKGGRGSIRLHLSSTSYNTTTLHCDGSGRCIAVQIAGKKNNSLTYCNCRTYSCNSRVKKPHDTHCC